MRFPLSYANGSKMLTAYFDDSGTHDDSAFVLYGGLYGTDEQWKAFDIAWKTKLANPVPNRPPLQRFHMVDCHHGNGQFLGYSKAEQDVLIQDLRNIIISHGLHGYCCGGSRVDWDDLVLGDMRSFLGDVERFCVTQCFVWVDGWAERNGYEGLAYVLDNRPHRSEANRRVFEFFQRYHEVTKEGPINEDISFESSVDTTPLQAADLVAWEYYQLGKEWLLTRDESKKRAHLQRLSEARIMDVQFFGREHIEEMVAYHKRHNPIISADWKRAGAGPFRSAALHAVASISEQRKWKTVISAGVSLRLPRRPCFVILETGMESFRYTTDGGTAFVIDNQDGLHALTCYHVVQRVDPNQIAITDTMKRSFRRLAAARQRRAFSLLPVLWRSTRRLGALRSDRVARP